MTREDVSAPEVFEAGLKGRQRQPLRENLSPALPASFKPAPGSYVARES